MRLPDGVTPDMIRELVFGPCPFCEGDTIDGDPLCRECDGFGSLYEAWKAEEDR